MSRLISLGFSVLGIPSKVTTQVLECHLLATAALGHIPQTPDKLKGYHQVLGIWIMMQDKGEFEKSVSL